MKHIINFFNYLFTSPDVPVFPVVTLIIGLLTAVPLLLGAFIYWEFSYLFLRVSLIVLILITPSIYLYLNRPNDSTNI